MAHWMDYLIDLPKGSWTEVGQSATAAPVTVARVATSGLLNIPIRCDASYSSSTQSGTLVIRRGGQVIGVKQIHGAGRIDYSEFGKEDRLNDVLTASLSEGGVGVAGDVTLYGYSVSDSTTDVNLLGSLMSWWKLDEASGNRADAFGLNTLSDNATVTSAAGKINDAALFTSVNSEYLSVVDSHYISLNGTSFTIAFWVYMTTIGADRTFASKWAAAMPREFAVQYIHATTDFRFKMNNADVVASAFTPIAATTWYFIVAWYDKDLSTMNISVNNAAADTAGSITASLVSTAPFYLGALDSGGATSFHNGRLDEMGLWRRVLTAAERTQLYNGSNGINFGELT